jgi:serine/threonine-protein kinase
MDADLRDTASRGLEEVVAFDNGTLVAGRYLLLERLGGGGMATVHRARDLLLDEVVAVKVPRTTQRHAEARERLLTEARLSMRISHRSVIRVRDVAVHDGLYVLVMEYVQGETLAERWHRQGAFEIDELLPVLSQVAAALDAIHAAGVVHCDLKPENLLITDDGRVVLLDFGIARHAPGVRGHVRELAPDVTSSGTPCYMAPEQINGEAVDARTDLYALGVMLYEMLAGRSAWTGPTPSAVMLARFRRPPPDLLLARPDLPAGLARLIGRCMSLSAGERPVSAGAVEGELRHTVREALLAAEAAGRRVPGVPFVAARRTFPAGLCGRRPIPETLPTVELPDLAA